METESTKTTNKKHIIASIVISTILILFSINASKCSGNTCDVVKSETPEYQIFPNMTPEIISEKLTNNEIVLLDVREDYEWDAGHIAGAKHIPLGNIDSDTTKILPRDIPIYIYCRSGNRAMDGESKLRSLGFQNVENIGGIIHWQERGGTLVK